MLKNSARQTQPSLSSCVRLHEFPFEHSMTLAPLVDLLSDLPELYGFDAERSLVLADVGAVAEGAEAAQGGSGAVDLMADFGEADGAALPAPLGGGAAAVVGGQSGAGAAAAALGLVPAPVPGGGDAVAGRGGPLAVAAGGQPPAAWPAPGAFGRGRHWSTVPRSVKRQHSPSTAWPSPSTWKPMMTAFGTT